MDEAWYIVEQQIRERLTEARKAARIRALTHDRTSTPRRMSSVRTTIIRLAKWALGSRNAPCIWSSHRRWPTSNRRRTAASPSERKDTTMR